MPCERKKEQRMFETVAKSMRVVYPVRSFIYSIVHLVRKVKIDFRAYMYEWT